MDSLSFGSRDGMAQSKYMVVRTWTTTSEPKDTSTVPGVENRKIKF